MGEQLARRPATGLILAIDEGERLAIVIAHAFALHALRAHEAEGDLPTTFNIAAYVYRVKPDKDGNSWINEAQHAGLLLLRTLPSRFAGTTRGDSFTTLHPIACVR
jgi:hypothetical protein